VHRFQNSLVPTDDVVSLAASFWDVMQRSPQKGSAKETTDDPTNFFCCSVSPPVPSVTEV